MIIWDGDDRSITPLLTTISHIIANLSSNLTINIKKCVFKNDTPI